MDIPANISLSRSDDIGGQEGFRGNHLREFGALKHNFETGNLKIARVIVKDLPATLVISMAFWLGMGRWPIHLFRL